MNIYFIYQFIILIFDTRVKFDNDNDNAGDDGATVPANIIKAVNEDRGKRLWIQPFEQLEGKQLEEKQKCFMRQLVSSLFDFLTNLSCKI